MTGKEARPLIEAVQEAGGPLSIEPLTLGGYVVFEAGSYLGAVIAPETKIHDGYADSWVGHLERDLMTRGVDFETGYLQLVTDEPWWVRISEQDDGDLISYADGQTKLEALLHAWTDAADLLRWGQAGT